MTKALKEIGYKGDFTYEIGGFKKMPREAVEFANKYMVACGRHMIKQIEE